MNPSPGPGHRRGPRPLLLHLMLAGMTSPASNSASPSLNDDWTRWLRQFQPGGASNPNPEPPQVDHALIAGIAAYRRHPYTRDVVDPPPCWTEGASQLRDYGGDGPPMLLVPSLINRGTVLDLSRERSMARFLAASGFRTLLLDWGWPGPEERQLDLDALITGRLARAIHSLQTPVILIGYCMGGLLTVAATLRQPQNVAALALLATPWDFHATDRGIGPACAKLITAMEPLLAVGHTLPVDALQMLFSLSDPHGVGTKYRNFGRLDQTSARARHFVALEDWLNDGVPLAAPIARNCLSGWYGENQPANGTWIIGGQPVDPTRLAVPCFLAIPQRDRIVPPESAEPLAALIDGATVHRPPAGHVGMVAGSIAEAVLWRPLRDWATAATR